MNDTTVRQAGLSRAFAIRAAIFLSHGAPVHPLFQLLRAIHLDDFSFILDKPDVRQIGGYTDAFVKGRYLTYLTFSLNYRMGGFDTFGFHLFNIFAHALAAGLVFILAWKLTAMIRSDDGQSLFLSAGTALLFAVHPMNTESVAYIYHRSESLSTAFYLLSLILFLMSVERGTFFLVLSLSSFAAGFFCKETAVTLPVVILAVDYLFLSPQT